MTRARLWRSVRGKRIGTEHLVSTGPAAKITSDADPPRRTVTTKMKTAAAVTKAAINLQLGQRGPTGVRRRAMLTTVDQSGRDIDLALPIFSRATKYV
jgi:hypothetical protein